MNKFFNTVFRIHLIVVMLLSGVMVEARTICGTVLDQTGNPIEFVNVKLMTDSLFADGRSTDVTGAFLFESVDSTPNHMLISMIGYEEVDTLISGAGDLNMNIRLQPSAVVLSDVEVSASVPRTQLKGNALVTNVSNTLLSTLGSANDVLRHIPMVNGSDGNYQVFGRGEAVIYINGRKVRNPSDIEQISSGDIKNIEVITNPGVVYAADVKAVIKIITRRPVGDGFSVRASSRFSYDRRLQNNDQINLKYRSKGLEIFGDFSGTVGSFYHEEYSYTTVFNNNKNISENTNYIEFTRVRGYSGKGGFSYQFNDNHSIGAYYENGMQWRHTYGDYLTDITENGVFMDSSRSDADKRSNNLPSHSANMYYVGKVGDFNIDFNGDYLYDKSHYDDSQYETNTVAPDRHITTANTSRSRLYAEKMTLSYALPKGEIIVGEEYTNSRRSNDFDNPQGLLKSELTDVKENNIGVFAELSHSFGRFNGKLGARYEHVNFDYYVDGNKIDNQSRTYNRFFPSLGVGYNSGNFNVDISYSTRIDRPSYSSLSGNYRYYNSVSYIRGNPSLVPAISNELSLQSSWKIFYMNAQYSYIKDNIMRVYEPYEDDWSITVFTPVNIPRMKTFALNIGASPVLGKWESNLNVAFRKQWLDIEYLGEIKKMNTPLIGFQMSNFFNISSDFYLKGSAMWYSHGNSGNWYIPRTTSAVNIGVVKMFFNKSLTVSLTFNDIFNGQLDPGEIYSGNVYTSSWAKNYRRSVELLINYNFNTTKSRYKGNGSGAAEKGRL